MMDRFHPRELSAIPILIALLLAACDAVPDKATADNQPVATETPRGGTGPSPVESVPTDIPLPPGWNAVELTAFRSTEDYHFRTRMPGGGVEARGDFDGDGRMDAARLVENNDRTRCAVFITHSPKGTLAHLQRWVGESACTDPGNARFFVALENPSTKPIDTWCGKGGGCEPGDPATLVLTRPAIAVGAYEAGYSLTYWDQQAQNWRETVISD
jgi:hypothetical protein